MSNVMTGSAATLCKGCPNGSRVILPEEAHSKDFSCLTGGTGNDGTRCVVKEAILSSIRELANANQRADIERNLRLRQGVQNGQQD